MSLPLRQSALSAIFGAAALMFLSGAPVHGAPLDAYLPKSGIMDAKIMVVIGSPELEKIAEKMQAAVVKDREWFLAYAKQYNTTPRMPYDPRFGITEDEYEQIGHAKTQLSQIGQAKITVKTDAKGGIVLEAPPNAKMLAGIKIAANRKSAVTPLGTLSTQDEIHQTDADGPTGRWEGLSFKTAAERKAAAPEVMIAFGKREKEGDGIMYYRVSASAKGPAREVILLYPLD